MERVATLCAILVLLVSGTVPARAGEQPPSPGTLCILDFNSIGDSGDMEWLAPGLADMMIATMGRLSPYRIVEREHLQEILREHRLGTAGLLDPELSVRAGRLAKAQFLLTGNFAVAGEEVTVQARLLRLADQKLISRASWEGPPGNVLLAAGALSRSLLAGIGTPFDEKFLAGIEKEIPQSIDGARSFYLGAAAFDSGDYPLALARYLESSRENPGFARGRRETFRLYYLLGRSDHAILFANRTARLIRRDDLPRALEFLHMASRKAVEPLGKPQVAIALLEEIDRLAGSHDEATGETDATAAFMRRLAASLSDNAPGDPLPDMLSHHDVRRKIWTAEIPGQLERRERSGGFEWVRRAGEWRKEQLPEPTVFMWRIRAWQDLGRLLAREGRTEEGLAYYRRILEAYSFVGDLLPPDRERRFYWDSGIRLEAHFMILRHYGRTGNLLRDPVLMPRLNEVGEGSPFTRDFADPDPDPRARVWSRRDDGSHEYFDFAAPKGRKITEVVFEAEVERAAWLSVNLPDAKGWPPQFDFSRRLEKVRLSRGKVRRTFRIPEGTELISFSVLQGPRWGGSFFDRRFRKKSPDGVSDISRWSATFVLASRGGEPEAASPVPDEEDGRILHHYAGKWGWEGGTVVRRGGPRYSNSPRRDNHKEQWIAVAMDGDVAVHHQETLVEVNLPVTVNTDEPEFAPCLVPTREGGYGLLWSRGLRGSPSGRFVSRTTDFVGWETPRRMVFEDAPAGSSRSRLEGSMNVSPVRDGYVMLLDDGWVRYSPDLVNWGEPRKLFDCDGLRQRIVTTRDGRLWVVATKSEDREMAPGIKRDMQHGYFTTADGKVWQKREAVMIYTSLDGYEWTEGVSIHTGPEPSGLWALPLSSDSIAVAVGYGSLNLRWLASEDPEHFRAVSSPLRLALNTDEVHFFLRDGKVRGAFAVHDFMNETSVLLVAESGLLHTSLKGGRP